MKGLGERGVVVTFPGMESQPKALEADVQLLTVWVSSLATSMSANVVLQLRYHHPDSTIEERRYRGTETSMNWASGDDEIQEILNRAFGEALDKMALDAVDLSTHPHTGSTAGDDHR